jgi:hypothetical protein
VSAGLRACHERFVCGESTHVASLLSPSETGFLYWKRLQTSGGRWVWKKRRNRPGSSGAGGFERRASSGQVAVADTPRSGHARPRGRCFAGASQTPGVALGDGCNDANSVAPVLIRAVHGPTRRRGGPPMTGSWRVLPRAADLACWPGREYLMRMYPVVYPRFPDAVGSRLLATSCRLALGTSGSRRRGSLVDSSRTVRLGSPVSWAA